MNLGGARTTSFDSKKGNESKLVQETLAVLRNMCNCAGFMLQNQNGVLVLGGKGKKVNAPLAPQMQPHPSNAAPPLKFTK